ncbi:MAG: helix-turn-helix transcriptional regulator [Minisyncoccia bacterium]
MRLQNNLKQIRLERGLLQKDVAQTLGLLNQDRLSHWETGRSFPTVPNLLKLCEIYRVELNKLYEQVDGM